MATTRLPTDFKEFLQLLNSENVEYLVVGGYAVGYYGYPRATGDLDVWIALRPANAEAVVRVLERFGYASARPSPELFLTPNRIIRMGMPPLRIELLTGVSGVDFDQCYQRRTTAVIDEVEVSVIALDDLKRNKKAAGRAKDADDLQNLG